MTTPRAEAFAKFVRPLGPADIGTDIAKIYEGAYGDRSFVGEQVELLAIGKQHTINDRDAVEGGPTSVNTAGWISVEESGITPDDLAAIRAESDHAFRQDRAAEEKTGRDKFGRLLLTID